MYCKSIESFEKNSIPKTKGASISVFSPESEKDFIVRRVELENGGSMPCHTNIIQHQQFVLSGEAKVIIGDEICHAREGDFLYIPAGVPHSYEACYDNDYIFLCMITTQEDEIVMIEA